MRYILEIRGWYTNSRDPGDLGGDIKISVDPDSGIVQFDTPQGALRFERDEWDEIIGFVQAEHEKEEG